MYFLISHVTGQKTIKQNYWKTRWNKVISLLFKSLNNLLLNEVYYFSSMSPNCKIYDKCPYTLKGYFYNSFYFKLKKKLIKKSIYFLLNHWVKMHGLYILVLFTQISYSVSKDKSYNIIPEFLTYAALQGNYFFSELPLI